MKAERIAKCPYCGSVAYVRSGTRGWFVLCDNNACDAIGPYGKTRQAALGPWNRVARAARKGKPVGERKGKR